MGDESVQANSEVKVLGSQRGFGDFEDMVNKYLKEGWKIVQTYKEINPDTKSEECCVLLGWPGSSRAVHPK